MRFPAWYSPPRRRRLQTTTAGGSCSFGPSGCRTKQPSRGCHPFERMQTPRGAQTFDCVPCRHVRSTSCHSRWPMVHGTCTFCRCLASIICSCLHLSVTDFLQSGPDVLRLASSHLPRPLPPCPHSHVH